tara:strand:+ start:671 stop:1231 length:561 start_codon:yes stop_codon:yes gene_type:complete
MAIEGDSNEYDLLAKWAKDFDCQGYKTCEIGVRKGLGSKTIMDNCKNYFMHVGIDPYGDLVYQHFDQDARGPVRYNYNDKMRDELLKDMTPYQSKFHLANMKDKEFFNDPNHANSSYAFVHFDGPHMTRDVMTQAIWFANRAPNHTRFVFDDYTKYGMDQVAFSLTYFDFKTIEAGEDKICLEKKI